jgi:hypothetical protein
MKDGRRRLDRRRPRACQRGVYINLWTKGGWGAVCARSLAVTGALVAELADAGELDSPGSQGSYGFESRLGHTNYSTKLIRQRESPIYDFR